MRTTVVIRTRPDSPDVDEMRDTSPIVLLDAVQKDRHTIRIAHRTAHATRHFRILEAGVFSPRRSGFGKPNINSIRVEFPVCAIVALSDADPVTAGDRVFVRPHSSQRAARSHYSDIALLNRRPRA